MWSDTLLRLTPEQELTMARSEKFSSDSRSAAYARYEVKRYYEVVVLADRVKLDVTDLDPQMAAEITRLRARIGINAPWVQKGQLAA